MQLFYLENPSDEIKLCTEESKHIIRVLRKKRGDIINFTDGKGGFFTYQIVIADSKKLILKIVNSKKKQKNTIINYILPLPLLKILIGLNGF